MDLTYIIPLCNNGNKDFPIRVRNLQFIYDNFIQKQTECDFEVLFVQQTTRHQTPAYSQKLKIKGNTRFITVKYPVFNKGWLINVGVLNAKSPVVMVAEADVMVYGSLYFNRMLEAFKSPNYKWAFAWDFLYYLSCDETTNLLQGSQVKPFRSPQRPRPNGPEGGILIYDRSWYLSIGGHNEWLEGLGGPDNEMANRAKFVSKTYYTIPETIIHLWHPIVKKSAKIDIKRNYNRQIIRFQADNMPRMSKLLSNQEIGKADSPACAGKTYFQMRAG